MELCSFLTFDSFITDPLTHNFMRKALLMSSLVAAVCGFLSSYLTLKGWALMGDAVSHSVMPGVVVAYALGLPFSLGAFIFGVGSVALIGFIKQKSRVKEDTVIGLVFTGFFALGIVLVSKIKSNIDLHSILFGSPLGISLSDVKQTIFISLLVVILLSIFRKDLMLYCFDPRHAKTVGINVLFLHYLLLTCLSLAAVVGLQSVGIILVVAMLITPGATAYLLTDKFNNMTVISVLSAIISSLIGIYVSFWFDLETGGSIVLAQTFIFLFAFLFAPRYGIFKLKKLFADYKC
ncbi:ABC transporter component, possibly Mn transport [Prochlorococcus marinus str. MIT 9215]|uniref:ABC transporter component, possibly Mn transport n=1 Tax=Prochlorococcus marinus (strain MIT 9215) TaxID=93060 RepID=A8G3W9_PROM2|nr:metal ABC transporter permease [Prochlorococcus marinus]ABV50300.1 ABC transporter component, possibly Mn transport [Prochlorococcus marinus str. MIT 9215]